MAKVYVIYVINLQINSLTCNVPLHCINRIMCLDQVYIGKYLFVRLGCRKTVTGVSLKNTHNAGAHDFSTKKFRILGSATNSGPWQELLVADLEDSRRQDPPPLQQLIFDNSAVVSFVKFELLEYHGSGGGLQYFAIEGGESTTSTIYPGTAAHPIYISILSGHNECQVQVQGLNCLKCQQFHTSSNVFVMSLSWFQMSQRFRIAL